MSPEKYIAARVYYLQNERAFRRTVGIIVQRPENYSDQHEEIWDDGVQEVWDGAREFNLDEVPFTISMRTKQIVAWGERPSVLKKSMTHLGKYRQGTLVMVTDFVQIVLMVIIYPKGGKGVAQKIKNTMRGAFNREVMWECTPSGSMTAEIWRKTMIYFRNKTKKI